MPKPALSIQVVKEEIASQTLEMIRVLKDRDFDPVLGAVFYVFDAGNGPFHIYAVTGADSFNAPWHSILEEEYEIADGFLSWAKSLGSMINEGLLTDEDLQEDYFAQPAKGDLVRIGWGDSDLNRFIGKLAKEVVLDLNKAGAFDGLLHPKGCVVYFSDDEVLGHETFTKCTIGAQGLFGWLRGR